MPASVQAARALAGTGETRLLVCTQRAPSARGAVAVGDSKVAIRRGLGKHAQPFESPAQGPQGPCFSPP